MEKEPYTIPEMNVVYFEAEDVITASTPIGQDGWDTN